MQEQQKIQQIQQQQQQQKQQQQLKQIESFQQLNLKDDLLKRIYQLKFQRPSKIQKKVILSLINKRDLIVQAKAGSGKTIAYIIGILQNINIQLSQCQVLILVPTRQIAFAVRKAVQQISANLHISSFVLCGGTNPITDRATLKKDAYHVIIGTPGRVNDFVQKQLLNLQNLKTFILDQADSLFDRGFQNYIIQIYQNLKDDFQACIFSSTIPPQLMNISNKITKNPLKINQKQQQLTLTGLRQFYILVKDDSQKFQIFKLLIQNLRLNQCIMFVKNCQNGNNLYSILTQNSFSVSMINQSTKQEKKEEQEKKFYKGKSRVLILDDKTSYLSKKASNVNVSLLINYDLPQNSMDYLRRVGRSQRFVSKRFSIIFSTPFDCQKIKNYRDYFRALIQELPYDLSSIQSQL